MRPGRTSVAAAVLARVLPFEAGSVALGRWITSAGGGDRIAGLSGIAASAPLSWIALLLACRHLCLRQRLVEDLRALPRLLLIVPGPVFDAQFRVLTPLLVLLPLAILLNQPVISGVLIAAGALAGLFLGGRYLLVLPLVLVEGSGGSAAARRSRALVGSNAARRGQATLGLAALVLVDPLLSGVASLAPEPYSMALECVAWSLARAVEAGILAALYRGFAGPPSSPLQPLDLLR
jgi:hypothetical protein